MRPIECQKCKHNFVSKKDKEINVICPVCNINYCNKNDTERFLFLTQDLYLKGTYTKNQFITKIYNVLCTYTKSLILGNFRKRLVNPDDLEDYVTQAVHFFLIYFLKNDSFFIDTSFSGMIFHKIKQAMKNENSKKPKDVVEITLNYFFEDDSEVEYEDTTKDCLKEIEEYEDKIRLYEFVKNLIFKMGDFCNDNRENFLRIIAIHHYLKYGEKKADNLFKFYSRYGKIQYERTVKLLYEELKRLYSEEY